MNLWLYSEFFSDKSTKWRVEIYGESEPPTADFEPRETTLTSKGFELIYDGKSQEPFQQIVGSKVEFTLYYGTVEMNQMPSGDGTETVTVDLMITRLRTEEEGHFQLKIIRDPDGDNEFYWAGVILGEQTEIENAPLPRELALTAVCELANLYKVDYLESDGSFYTGPETFMDVVRKCLLKARTIGFWSLGDDFLWTQRYFNTSVAIADGNADPYLYHRCISDELILSDDGVLKRPLSCGEVLERVCDTFMASIYLSQGKFFLIPRLCISNSPLYSLNKYDIGGNLLAANSSLNPFFTIGTGAGQAKILKGGSDQWLHPVRSVRREYNFRGQLPLVSSTNATLGDNAPYQQPIADLLGVEFESEFFVAPSGTAFQTQFFWQINQTADGTRTGDARALRYKMQVRFKMGDYYLKRLATQVGSGIFTLAAGEQISVFQPYNADVAWTTDTGDLWEIYSQVVNAKYGANINQQFSIITPALPDDESGLLVEIVTVEAYEADGDTSSIITDDALADCDMQLFFQAYVLNNGGGQGLENILFEGAFDNNAREDIELNEAFFGDQISTLSTKGSIRYNDNFTLTSDDWKIPTAAGLEFINALLVKTYAQHRHRSKRTRLMKVFHTPIYMWSLPFYETIFWCITSLRFTASLDEYDLEFIEMSLSGTITVAQVDRFSAPPAGGNPSAAIESVQQSVQSVADTTAATATRQLNLQPLGVGGIVLRSTEGAVNAVTYTPRAGVDASVEMPLSFPIFLVLATRITTDTERWISFANGVNLAVREYDTEFIVPFDGLTVSMWIRVENAATVTVKIYVNGTSVASDSSAMGAGDVLEFSLPDEVFNAGDLLSVSVQGSVATGNTNVTLMLKG
jgi:hypothetical protein